ncbi:MAG: polysaccharide pyruvyl transferase family protein [Clostridia bacterium]|nr:polysaccharide pyruvyl transferase family protein [Clostridia bacterium]
MKIGIVTIAQGANYGNRLQNYAVQEVFRKMGCRAETIAYDTEYNCTVKLLLLHFIKAKILRKKIYHLQKRDKFCIFNKQKINFSKKKYKCGEKFDISGYDMFSVGSDQVWNLYFKDIVEYRDLMFLTFVPAEKKIAYSASIGTDKIPEEFKVFFANSVKDFSNISVRETQGADIIEKHCDTRPETTIDPTLMLDRQKWVKFAKKPKNLPKKDFIVVYFISSLSDDIKEYIKSASELHDCEVVTLKSGCAQWVEIPDPKYFCADPQEFVYLISHAKAVITDSFHASVFSIIFKQPFRIFERKDLNMSSRTQELLDKIHIGKWCLGNISEPPERIIDCDYTDVDEAIEQERQKAFVYLKKALNI